MRILKRLHSEFTMAILSSWSCHLVSLTLLLHFKLSWTLCWGHFFGNLSLFSSMTSSSTATLGLSTCNILELSEQSYVLTISMSKGPSVLLPPPLLHILATFYLLKVLAWIQTKWKQWLASTSICNGTSRIPRTCWILSKIYSELWLHCSPSHTVAQETSFPLVWWGELCILCSQKGAHISPGPSVARFTKELHSWVWCIRSRIWGSASSGLGTVGILQ